MKILQHSYSLALALATCAASASVVANECHDLSTLRMDTGDAYFELPLDGVRDKQSTERETRSRAERYNTPEELDLLRKTDFRKGTGTRYICTGTEQNPVVQSEPFDIAEYRVSDFINGDVIVRVLEDGEKHARRGVMEFPADSTWARENRRVVTNSRLYRQRIDLDRPRYKPENFRFENYAVSNFNPAPNFLAEVQTRIERIGKGMRLTQAIFHNGQKVEWVVWDLKG